MLGESPERTGAIALLERSQDPGALHPLPPDEHTPWGESEVEEEDIRPSGVALIARIALSDVWIWRGPDATRAALQPVGDGRSGMPGRHSRHGRRGDPHERRRALR